MLLRLSAISLVANCVLAPLAAQELPARPPLSAEDVLGVGWSDGELHAVTQAYVARFDPGAVELTPAFGRSARRTYPMRISMRSIGRGARESWRAAPGHAPLPELTETSVSYKHAAGIVERYDARTDGLKQSVVFAAEPEGRGDLVVRYALETDLRCAPTERAASLWFAADEVGGVAVGAVTGIDAAGRRADGHMAFDGTELVLTLPEAFVATASYPLELDPLFGPQLNTGVSFDDHFPDIAYDAASGVWGVAFEFPASATSSAAYMMRQDDATGAMLGGVFLGLGEQVVWDMGFVLLLLLTGASGLLLYAATGTSLVPALLALHLGAVLAFFLTTPYSKMAHGFYRLAALIRDAQRPGRA